MRAEGFPLARLGSALACSVAVHAAAAWWLGAFLAAPANSAGGGGEAIRARLVAQAAPGPQAPAPGPVKAATAARNPKQPAAVPAPVYLEQIELDVRPQIMTHVMPEYPTEIVSGTRGRVVLEIYIGESGLVDRARVALAEPAGAFDAAAVKAFASARFTPGIKNQAPVASKMVVEIRFGE